MSALSYSGFTSEVSRVLTVQEKQSLISK
jgi:hypothetical protein